jgi:hypothetical protein
LINRALRESVTFLESRLYARLRDSARNLALLSAGDVGRRLDDLQMQLDSVQSELVELREDIGRAREEGAACGARLDAVAIRLDDVVRRTMVSVPSYVATFTSAQSIRPRRSTGRATTSQHTADLSRSKTHSTSSSVAIEPIRVTSKCCPFPARTVSQFLITAADPVTIL